MRGLSMLMRISSPTGADRFTKQVDPEKIGFCYIADDERREFPPLEGVHRYLSKVTGKPVDMPCR